MSAAHEAPEAMMGVPPDIAGLRRALGCFATGVTIVTADDAGRAHGMTANSFTSVSLNPPLLLVCIDNRAKMAALLGQGRYFGMSILSSAQEPLSRHFASRTGAELEVSFDVYKQVPLIRGALAHFACRVVETSTAGDHTIFIGEVEHHRWEEGRPLLFYGGGYQRLDGLETPL